MLPETDVVIQRQPGLICEDTFTNGPNGWTQLIDGTKGRGVISLDSEITHEGSRYSLWMGTEDYSMNAAKPWGGVSVIKRLSRGPAGGKLYAEWWWAYGALRAEETTDDPRNIDFGIDQAAPDGTRRFFKLRWQNYDETVPGIVSDIRLHVDGATPYVVLPDGAVSLGVNENKRNLWHFELVVDLDTGVYDGVRVNGKGWGSLATTPDESLRAYGPPAHTLAHFASGLNACVELYNRTDDNNSKSWMNLAYFRAVQS